MNENVLLNVNEYIVFEFCTISPTIYYKSLTHAGLFLKKISRGNGLTTRLSEEMPVNKGQYYVMFDFMVQCLILPMILKIEFHVKTFNSPFASSVTGLIVIRRRDVSNVAAVS